MYNNTTLTNLFMGRAYTRKRASGVPLERSVFGRNCSSITSRLPQQSVHRKSAFLGFQSSFLVLEQIRVGNTRHSNQQRHAMPIVFPLMPPPLEDSLDPCHAGNMDLDQNMTDAGNYLEKEGHANIEGSEK
jgi:hypothetical protein